VVPTSQALELAREANLDLVEVAPQERPPVCKILDYGKFRYQQSRKGTKTKVHQQKVKEIRVRPKTGEHDIDTKINQARKFLEHKDKVLLNVLFRGRELQHIEEGRRIIDAILEKLDFMPKLFTPEDLSMMLRLRSAFNPEGRCSPRKMLPTAGACIEQSKVSRRAAL